MMYMIYDMIYNFYCVMEYVLERPSTPRRVLTRGE
jgi:hypothetical protein